MTPIIYHGSCVLCGPSRCGDPFGHVPYMWDEGRGCCIEVGCTVHSSAVEGWSGGDDPINVQG